MTEVGAKSEVVPVRPKDVVVVVLRERGTDLGANPAKQSEHKEPTEHWVVKGSKK